MQTAGPAVAPPAFYAFCQRDFIICDSSSGAKIVGLTAALASQLTIVNSAVNSRILEREDWDVSGVEDDWRLPLEVGDCEDFAIAKKSELMQLGWPASALLLTVINEEGGGHTVLTVTTDRGDLILDSRISEVLNWQHTSYRYYARQSQDVTGQWVLIVR
jgi:predicted transglutaminase-like cysteine proteinase